MNSWWIGEWQECKATCATQGIGYRKRSVLCVTQKPSKINERIEVVAQLDKQCENLPKPNTIETCRIDLENCENKNGSSSQAYWIAEEWNRVLLFLIFNSCFN